MTNCKTCKHKAIEHDGNVDSVHCRHDTIKGGLACESCKAFQALDAFDLTRDQPPKLRCAKCGHSQVLPKRYDWRCGFVAFDDGAEVEPPRWCAGYSPSSIGGTAPPEKKPPQLTLF